METIQRLLRKPLRVLLARLYYFVIANDLFLTKRLLFRYCDGPHRRMQEVNESIVRLLLQSGLKSTDRVLEIGCGSGRLAYQLLSYLKDTGNYTGLDILPKEVEWCRNKIGKHHSNFHFEHFDIYNNFYNPKGRIKASDYGFPWNDGAFDFVVLISVFTHMPPREIENYLSEIARVLRKDGKCLATFFILNEESKRLMGTRSASVNFRFDCGGYCTVDKENPESIAAHEEALVRELYDDSGLKILDPILYGSWSGRQDFLTHQDIVVSVNTIS
jgi:SAM-dependent methyltransferase